MSVNNPRVFRLGSLTKGGLQWLRESNDLKILLRGKKLAF